MIGLNQTWQLAFTGDNYILLIYNIQPYYKYNSNVAETYVFVTIFHSIQISSDPT